jgi:protein-serine/threonine kinase
VNFRNVKESHSVDISSQQPSSGKTKTASSGGAGGVPLDSGLRTPGDEAVVDPFEEFNSVTLHHDGDDSGFIVHEPPGWENAVGRAR